MIILAAWLIADFFSGLVHWYEDRVLTTSRLAFVCRIAADNDLHHRRPMAMLKYSYWENINTSAIFTLPLMVSLWFIGAPAVLVWASFFATFANLVHRFAHTPANRLPMGIRILQKIGLFCSPEHHLGHHVTNRILLRRDQAVKRYCAMTNWLNPILERIRFFEALEFIFLEGERHD